MTGRYLWSTLPPALDVKCLRCGKRAYFEFAEVVTIREKKDVQFFKDSDKFDYLFSQGGGGNRWHAAFFYPGLHGRSVATIRELPDGYERSNWSHSKYLYRSSNFGVG